jgi:dienelactone hydrolase
MRSVALSFLLAAGLCAQPARLVPYVTPETPQGTGPYPAIMQQDARLATHTVYRPQNLAALNGAKLPIIAWGNGACVNTGNRFRYFLTEIASHGFLAIALGPLGPADAEIGPQPPNPNAAPATAATAPPTNRSAPATMSTQLLDAIDWAIAENARKDSPYFGRLDPSKIAVMGQSCGGVQALAVSADPRIQLIGIWNSGLLTPNPNAPPGPVMENVPKSQLAKLHTPIFYFTGDQANDIAYPNGLDDYQRIAALNHVPAFHAFRDGLVHNGTYREPNGGELGKIAVALLKWQFKGDKEAGKMFRGPACGLCQNPAWHVSKKNMD